MDRNLEDEYEVEIAAGYSSLERVGDYQFRTDPNLNYDDDPYTEVYEDAVYGGEAHPDRDQDFFVYEVDWPEGVGEPTETHVEELGEELNSVFDGWIINEEGERVFALDRDRD